MGASSVTGKGVGAVPLPEYVKPTSPDYVALQGKSDIVTIGKFDAPYQMSPLNLWDDAFNCGSICWDGGGLTFVPTSSSYTSCFCRNECFGCSYPCSCCCANPSHYILMAVNPEDITSLTWSEKFMWYNVDFSKLVNLTNLEVANIVNSDLNISGYKSLADFDMWDSEISNTLTIADNPLMEYLYVQNMALNESGISIDFASMPLLSVFDFSYCGLSADWVDAALNALAASVATDPRTGWADVQGNSAPTDGSARARAALVAAGWTLWTD